jgi:Cu(I)/Ag(I) efflux system membrane protein CusA/SilA
VGEVESVDKEHGEVVINHGDLPNLGMEAMTMGFAVADKRMLDRLKPGDKVRFIGRAAWQFSTEGSWR